jgi:hypothetical protein
MSAWSSVAAEVGVHERTLRRGHRTGWVRARRVSSRLWNIPPGEAAYLVRHWTLLADLREVLRTDHYTRLAVLTGPAAEREYDGVATPVVLAWLPPRPLIASRLGSALSGHAGRHVNVLCLDEDVFDRHGLELATAARRGRVLHDPARDWGTWKARARILRADGTKRERGLRPPDRYELDEEISTPERLATDARRDLLERWSPWF